MWLWHWGLLVPSVSGSCLPDAIPPASRQNLVAASAFYGMQTGPRCSRHLWSGQKTYPQRKTIHLSQLTSMMFRLKIRVSRHVYPESSLCCGEACPRNLKVEHHFLIQMAIIRGFNNTVYIRIHIWLWLWFPSYTWPCFPYFWWSLFPPLFKELM